MSAQTTIDTELEAVAAEYKKLDPDGCRTARVLRDTFDQLYDGQLTGRFCWEQLHKTEKTHCGTLVEINLHREFDFDDGSEMDYKIAGVEVDCKYSQTLNAWMIPPEARGHLCLLVWALDSASPAWSMGLVRVTAEKLNAGGNRDAKSTLNDTGRKAILWLFRDSPLPPNVLLQIERKTVDRIMAHTSGQARINDLLRSALCRIVGRAAVATVAEQADYMKRLRANGGREALSSQKASWSWDNLNHTRPSQAHWVFLFQAMEIRSRCELLLQEGQVMGWHKSVIGFGASPGQMTLS